MAYYKNGKYLEQSLDARFDRIYNPGEKASHPGIYRCVSCGDEIAIAGTHVLPPQNHHQHNPAYGGIKWQLLVMPDSIN
jgi:hypothetical protein